MFMLVIGGAASGKSAFAEACSAACGAPALVATMEPFGEEAAARIDAIVRSARAPGSLRSNARATLPKPMWEHMPRRLSTISATWSPTSCSRPRARMPARSAWTPFATASSRGLSACALPAGAWWPLRATSTSTASAMMGRRVPGKGRSAASTPVLPAMRIA